MLLQAVVSLPISSFSLSCINNMFVVCLKIEKRLLYDRLQTKVVCALHQTPIRSKGGERAGQQGSYLPDAKNQRGERVQVTAAAGTASFISFLCFCISG